MSLAPGSITTDLRLYPEGGMLVGLTVGLTERFSLGVSYGGVNIIGAGSVEMNPQPAVGVTYLILEERYLSPALMIGFNSQGYGRFIKDLNRYAIKSWGFYAVVSKNTSFLGGMGIHAGANWSLENEDGDNSPNFFVGCHKRINPELVILGEYDTALNDNNDDAIGSGLGYLNLGIRWSFAQRLFVEFSWKNILENGEEIVASGREVKLVYLTSF